jgi:hypothetical protein
VVRSGRSDTPARLAENVAFAAITQAGTQLPVGFPKMSKHTKVVEFQHVISSYMDPSYAKGMVSEDPEHIFWRGMQEAVDNWPPPGGDRIQVKFADDVERTVILKRPIICNQRLSPTLFSDYMGKEKSFHLNFLPNQQLLSRYLVGKKLTPEFEKAQEGAEKALGVKDLTEAKSMKLAFPDKINKTAQFFQTKEYKKYQEETAKFLLTQLQAAVGEERERVGALFAILFSRPPPAAGDKLPTDFSKYAKMADRDELHACDMEIYRNIYCEREGLSRAVQCKGGSDRTPEGVALAEAQRRYKQEVGETFWPENFVSPKLGGPEHKKLLQFKKFFREALLKHGAEMALETKGYSGLNMASSLGGLMKANPTIYKYLYMAEDKPYS